MADQAWAIVITKPNFPVILSESGRKFDKAFLERWFEQEDEGYFVRDRSSSLDCCLFTYQEFHRLYGFSHRDDGNLFREIQRLSLPDEEL